MKNKTFKKKLLTISLVGLLPLTACGKQKEVETATTYETTQDETQMTTQVTTEEITTEAEQIIEETQNEIDYYSLAAETYNNYTDFYSETKIAYADENADQGINIEKIENMIKLIKGDVSDLTESQIDDACECINYVLLSQNLTTQLSNVNDEALGYVTIEGKINVPENPTLIQYATEEETIEILSKYETLRNRVINDLETTNKVSEETKEALEKAVEDMEYNYLPVENDMNADVASESNKLLLNYIKKNLIDLTVLATNKSRIESEYYPGGLKLAAETDEERDVQSKVLIHGLDVLTDSEKELYSRLTMELSGTKYSDGICTHQENVKRHARDHVDTYSKIDTLKQYKEYLISLQNKETYSLSM